MVEPGLVGMDTTLMNDICCGFGHGKWSMDASAGAIRRPLPEYPATYGHLYLFTLHNLQGACTSLASCHSRHNPKLGFYEWENRGRVLCLRSHSQLTSRLLPPETTGGSPWLLPSRNRKPSHYLISPTTRPVITCFTVSSVICMPLCALVQRTQQQSTTAANSLIRPNEHTLKIPSPLEQALNFPTHIPEM